MSSQGTTGSPKGATLSHYNIVNNSNLIGQRLKMPVKVRLGWAQARFTGCWERKVGRAWGDLLGSPC